MIKAATKGANRVQTSKVVVALESLCTGDWTSSAAFSTDGVGLVGVVAIADGTLET